MHYCLTRRTDTAFWRDVQKPEHITDRLQAKLDHWRRKAPTQADFDDQSFYGFDFDRNLPADDPEIDPRPPVDASGLWNHASYESILFGMDFRGPEFEPLGDKRPKSTVVPFVLEAIRAAPQQLPPHHIWLHKALGMPAWQQGPRPAGWTENPYT